MPLDPKDGIGSYIKDFKKSKAPQFKGKSDKKRQQMAVAAYLDAKRGPQEASFAGNKLKLFGQLNRNGSKPELDRDKPTLAKLQKRITQKKNIKKTQSAFDKHNKDDVLSKHGFKRPVMDNVKEGSYKVSIAGLPDMYMDDKTPGALLQKLRKIVKQPSMIQDVERTTDAKKKKAFRQKAQGREVTEYKYDYGTPESVKLMKKQTPGQNEGTDAPKGPESYEAQYKRRLVKTTDPEHKAKGFKWRIKGKKDSSLTKKLYKTKPGQGEFNKQMKRIAGHEFG
mgnify:FL=1|tara:strand:+ start:388 stop:1230 length:843 start_codon:yes stop_codon:yes gene_type:complete